MKTFEKEKNNIPEGATHYIVNDGAWRFCWAKYQDGRLLIKINDSWVRTGWIADVPTIVEIPKSEVVEWSGEGLPPVGVECEMRCKQSSKSDWTLCKVFAYCSEMGAVAAVWYWFDNMWKHVTIEAKCYDFRKIETEAQREQRERLEAAYDLYREWVGGSVLTQNSIEFDEWKREPDFYKKWLRIVDKTNYRKGE